ncbi:hypothetical protein BH11VER1_BH11VER1_40010 [soil metagenome]
MNTNTLLSYAVSAVLVLAINDHAFSQGLTIPQSDAGIADSISNALPTPYTADELRTPPVGEIRKLRLRDVNSKKSTLQAALMSVPPADQANPNYSIALSAIQKIESVISDRQQDQLFSLIKDICALNEAAKVETNPSFVKSAAEALSQLKTSIVHEIAAYIVTKNATVPAHKLSLFVSAFTKGSIIEIGDWEYRTIPVSGAGITILDAPAVVTLIKAQPWQNAERFLEGATAAEAFSPFTSLGDELAVLRTKYASNEANIIAQWNELTAWVEQQRAANPSDTQGGKRLDEMQGVHSLHPRWSGKPPKWPPTMRSTPKAPR